MLLCGADFVGVYSSLIKNYNYYFRVKGRGSYNNENSVFSIVFKIKRYKIVVWIDTDLPMPPPQRNNNEV